MYMYMNKCKKRLLSNLEKFKVERCKSKIKILVNIIRFSIRYNYVSHWDQTTFNEENLQIINGKFMYQPII